MTEQSAENKALLELNRQVRIRGELRRNDGDDAGYTDSIRILAMFRKAFNATGQDRLNGDFKAHLDPVFKPSAESYLAEDKWFGKKAVTQSA